MDDNPSDDKVQSENGEFLDISIPQTQFKNRNGINITEDIFRETECSIIAPDVLHNADVNVNIEDDLELVNGSGIIDSNIDGNLLESSNNTYRMLDGYELEGRRVIDIQYFIDSLKLVANHAPHLGCNLNNLVIVGETRRGMASNINFQCSMCLTQHSISTVQNKKQLNNDAVMGVMSTGSGHEHLSQIGASLDIPVMSGKSFTRFQESVGDYWESSAINEMAKAAEEEKSLAIENGDVTSDGIPFITVVCDGVWAKRSYRHNYNSLSGAAAIVGYKTRKVLYLAVKNKFCLMCKRYPTTTPSHTCYKNWEGSASSMESAIINEGFMQSMGMYGLIYKRKVADGDSSCYKTILDNDPYKDFQVKVEKIECRNHLLRNYINKIRELGKDTNAGPLILRKEIKKNLLRFRYAITEAIKYRKNENGTLEEKGEKLRKDILNSPFHIFGQHKHCCAYFCQKQSIAESSCTHDVITDMKLTPLFDNIMAHVRYLSNHATSLIFDVDNNSAEQFNGIIAKYTGGKRVNYVLRRSYQSRCFASVVSHNTKIPLEILKKKCGMVRIGYYTQNYESCKNKRRNNKNKLRLLKKRNKYANAQGIKSSLFYGTHCEKPDLEEKVLQQAISEYLKELQLSSTEKKNIEVITRNQADSEMWRNERRKRVTASKFAEICKKMPESSRKNLIKSILYPKKIFAKSIKHGVENEKNAIKQLEDHLAIKVSKCGLFIDQNIDFIAASPDGIIEGTKALVEVKCPYSARDLTPEEGIANGQIKCWKKNGEFNNNHNWYYQVQGQLHVTGFDFCYFMVWTYKGFKVEKIFRDDKFWQDKIESKLVEFYMKCMLPEIVDSRVKRNMEIRN